MTRSEFIEMYRHALCGHIAEAAVTQAKGGELSMRIRLSFRAVDDTLGEIYDRLTRMKPALNGKAEVK